jgi:hypothetical protein
MHCNISPDPFKTGRNAAAQISSAVWDTRRAFPNALPHYSRQHDEVKPFVRYCINMLLDAFKCYYAHRYASFFVPSIPSRRLTPCIYGKVQANRHSCNVCAKQDLVHVHAADRPLDSAIRPSNSPMPQMQLQIGVFLIIGHVRETSPLQGFIISSTIAIKQPTYFLLKLGQRKSNIVFSQRCCSRSRTHHIFQFCKLSLMIESRLALQPVQ